MPRQAVVIDVNEHRAENYQYHFQRRQLARVHPDRENIAALVSALPKPTLNTYGVVSFEGKAAWPVNSQYLRPYYDLGKKLGFDLDLEYWYWSDAGWEEFERQWKELPEVVHMQVCTTGKVVHISTHETYVYASKVT